MAEDKRKIIRDLNELENERISLLREQNRLLVEEMQSAEAQFNIRLKNVKQEEYLNNLSEINLEYQKEALNAKKEGHEISDNVTDELEKQNNLYGDINKRQTTNNRLLAEARRTHGQIKGAVKLTWQYLMESDKVIRQTILNLGLSGEKAAEMRNSFEEAAGYAARLGGGLEDVQTVMQVYADETGRARALSAELVKNTIAIGRGTGLGVEQGARLAAQFELMGLNARAAMDYAQGVVETAELMGVNTTKVLKNISDNFRRLQGYTFTQGVQGFAEMATYAEKMRMDMSQALDAADVARKLEGAVDLAAQLQVMGGEFAKTDPFQLMFLARNDPAEYAKRINQMTRGIATFRKNADGALETFISPADIDRLRAVEQSLGMQAGELTTQARRMAEIQRLRQRTLGMGLTDEQQQAIEGLFTFDNKMDKFTVQIGGMTRDVTKLSSKQLELLTQQQSTLEERAKAAQTFDEVWRATINELKTILLPLLRGVNTVLTRVRPHVETFVDWVKKLSESQNGWLKIGGILLGAGVAWKSVGLLLTGAANSLSRIPAVERIGRTGRAAERTRRIRRTTRARAGMMTGIGAGAAGLGIGAGIGIAAEGISDLADAMSRLDPAQVETLKSIIRSLGWFIAGGAAAATGIAVIGATSTAVAPGLLAFGGAIALVGAGIGGAAVGIGFMAEKLSKLNENSEGIGNTMNSMAKGISAVASSVVDIPLVKLIGFSSSLKKMSERVEGVERVGNALKNFTMLSGMKDDFAAVERMVTTISRANLSNLQNFAALKDLRDVFNKPLQVEFSDKKVNLVSNISLNIDGYKLVEETNLDAQIVVNNEESRRGKRANRLTS